MRVSVRFIVIGLLLLAQLVTVGGLVVLSRNASNDAARVHAQEVLEHAARDAVAHTRHYLAPAETAVRYTGQLLKAGDVPTERLDQPFIRGLVEHPQLAGLFVGMPDGDFYYVKRSDDGFQAKQIEVEGSDRSVDVTKYGKTGDRLSVEADPADRYDPRQRPWYQLALAGDRDWTDPYVFFTSGKLGVTVSEAVFNDDGDVVAVVGADIELGALSDFLATLPIGEAGDAFITNAAGTVIGHSKLESVGAVAEDLPPTPVDIAEFNDVTTRRVYGAMISEGVSPEGVGSLEVDGVDGAAHAAFASLTVGSGKWTVGVHGDEADLVPGLVSLGRRENKLELAVGGLSIAMALILAAPTVRIVSRLERHATKDALTGISNRRSILATVEELGEKERPFALAMIDLDRFKSINDEFGHQVGDEVLTAVAQRLEAALRPNDHLGRLGGEEFLVTLVDVDGATARAAIERIHRAISAEPILTSHGPVTVTGSVGLAVNRGSTPALQVLADADTALFHAKETGRDRICAWPLERAMPPHPAPPVDEWAIELGAGDRLVIDEPFPTRDVDIWKGFTFGIPREEAAMGVDDR